MSGEGRSGMGCALAGLVLGLLGWWLHLMLTDTPVSSDAGFFDGVLHGSLISVSGVWRLFGGEVGPKEYFAHIGYDVGYGLGAGVWLSLVSVGWEALIDGTIGYGVERSTARFLWGMLGGFVVLVLVSWLVSGAGFAPMTLAEQVPDVWGVVPGGLRETLALIAADVMALAGLIAVPGGSWFALRR